MSADEPRAEKHTGDESTREARTTLRLEGVSPDEIPASVLLDVMDACEQADLSVDGVSILRDSSRR